MGKRTTRATRQRKQATPDTRAFRQGHWSLLGFIFLLVAAVWSFWPSLSGQWLITWDDSYMVIDNGKLRDLAGLWRIWVASPGVDYWPITSTFLWLEWHLFGLAPLGYHLCNLALHVWSGALIWRVLSQLGLRWGWFGGLLFVIHPLTVESIAWVSEVKNALSLPLFLWALSSYLQFDTTGESAAYVRSLALYIAAMLAKTSVVMLPVVLLLYCWWKRHGISRDDLKRTLPFFAVALFLGFITVHMQAPSSISELPPPRTPVEVVLTAGHAIFFYIGSFFAPFQLTEIYPRWTLESPTLLQLVLWPLMAGLLALAFLQKTWGRHVVFGMGFFLLTLSPLLGFFYFTFMKFSWVADHFVYLPMVGLIGLVVAGVEWLHGAIPLAQRPILPIVVGMLVLGLSLEARYHAQDFCNDTALWTQELLCNPQSVPAYNNLGLIEQRAGDNAGAIRSFGRALQIQPNYIEAHCNLASALMAVGDSRGATGQIIEATQINPKYPIAHYDLGTLYLESGRLPEAIAELKIALELDPHREPAESNLGYALLQSGRPDEAVHILRSGLQDDPNSPQAHLVLGMALLQLKDYAAAATEFQATLVLSPGMTEAQQLLQKAQQFQASPPAGR